MTPQWRCWIGLAWLCLIPFSGHAVTPMVSADAETVLTLKSDGTVYAWGGNRYGQLGNGTRLDSSTPIQVIGLSDIRSINAAGYYMYAVKQDGAVFRWGGWSDLHPVKLLSIDNVISVFGRSGGISGIDFRAFALKVDGTVWSVDPSDNAVHVEGLSSVTAIAIGGATNLALKSDGTVWAWEDNINTPASQPRNLGLTGITAIVASSGFNTTYNLALKSDGTVWAWGDNASGQLGDGTTTNRLSPVFVQGLSNVMFIAAGGFHSVAIRSDGTVWDWGQSIIRGIRAPPGPVPGISNAMAVAAASNSFTIVLSGNGTLSTLGIDNGSFMYGFGRLGDGTFARRNGLGLVINQDVSGFLDLIPEVANNIPPEMIPPFFLATYRSGEQISTSLYADLRGITASGTFASESDFGRFAAGYNVYVAASVPSIPSALFQLDSSNSWSVLNWPMAAFLRGVALDSQNNVVRAQILQDVDLSSPAFVGTSIIVGYGTDPDEMARNARYRIIFTVPQP